jgi:TetR/AcrR family tetracycline transcriptional repressor
LAIVPYRPPSPTVRRTLDRAQIVDAALALLNEVGLDGLSMRSLAERLGVKAASLYRHVRDKQELLVHLSDKITGELPPLDPRARWTEQLMSMARAHRNILTSHRDAPRLFASTAPLGPKRLRSIEVVLAILKHAGLADVDAARSAHHFNNFVTEFAADEARFESAAEALGGKKKLAQQSRKAFKSLPKEEYPTLVALADQLIEVDGEASFEFGLSLWIRGLEQHLESSRR